ncbi:hypothetical protein SFC08_14725 [Lysinibacillus halotolerans]
MLANTLQIDANYLIEPIKAMGIIIVFSFIYRAIFVASISDFKLDEILLYSFKLLGYGFLAGYIYFKVLTTGVEEIDVLTFFTFILAAFEATHNFILTISISIGGIIRTIFNKLFHKGF